MGSWNKSGARAVRVGCAATSWRELVRTYFCHTSEEKLE